MPSKNNKFFSIFGLTRLSSSLPNMKNLQLIPGFHRQQPIVKADFAYDKELITLIKSDLIKKGINESSLILDKNGNRTWISITNLKGKNNFDNIIIISQKFHLERAIYISNKKKINALGLKAKGNMSNRLWIREVLARVKMRIDLITSQ